MKQQTFRTSGAIEKVVLNDLATSIFFRQFTNTFTLPFLP